MLPTDLPLLRTPGVPALSPDGRDVVVSVTRPDMDGDESTGRLWSIRPGGDGAPVQLTRGHRDTSPTFSPDGRWIAFCRALPGEPPQLHLVEAGGGEPVRLTDAPLGVSAPQFSPDGARIAYLARVPQEGRYLRAGSPAAEAPRLITTFRYRADDLGFTADRRQHLFALAVPAAPGDGDLPEPTRLTAGDVEVTGHRWLPDGEHLVAVSAVHTSREEDLRRDAVLVAAPKEPSGHPVGAPVPLTHADRGSDLCVEAVAPSADGTTLWLLAGDMGPSGREFVAALTGLYRLDLSPGGEVPPRPVRLTDPATVDLATGVLVVTPQEVLVADQRRGAVELCAVPTSAREVVTPLVVRCAPAVVLGAAAAGGRVVVTEATPTSVGRLAELTGEGWRELADWSVELRATGRVRPARELTATAPDGYPVHGWVTVPDPARYAGPRPTVLMIHGGPFAQYTHALFDEVQVLVEAGWAVVQPNPRGSAGYGSEHGAAIRHAFGTIDADDVLALLDAALDADPGLDRSRVGVMGGSYGGYLSAWLTTRTDRFAAAVVERGFLDPVSFTGSSDIGWFFGLEYLGDPGTAEGAAAVAAQSPMAHVDAVSTPTLVIHSEQDWRCPVEQGQRWFVELRRRGVPAELLLFPGEGHELTRSGRPSHRRARFEHLLRWWSTHLAVD